MKEFSICQKEDFAAAAHLFGNAHYIDLNNGQILLCAEFSSENHKNKWHGTEAVHFPHPLSSQTVGSEIANHLVHLNIQPSDSTYQAVQKISAIHPLMKLE